MNGKYIIQILLSIISFGILLSVYYYLEQMKECACFVENQHPKYKVNVEFLQLYQILEMVSLGIFIIFITMYKRQLFKGGSKSGMKFFVILSVILFLFISGYVSLNSILMYFISKKDCVCMNKWQKYIVYIQGVYNSIYFLRILFAFVFALLLITFNMK
uniref:Uncharacterized protein n=1 Tax=viral metagenome TaxID=1070528 RepID=A0A6C0KJL4_9ZZZZ